MVIKLWLNAGPVRASACFATVMPPPDGGELKRKRDRMEKKKNINRNSKAGWWNEKSDVPLG